MPKHVIYDAPHLPTLVELLSEIVGESRNGCTDPRSTWEHMKRRYKLTDEQIRPYRPFLDSINYHAIRENLGEHCHGWTSFFDTQRKLGRAS